MSTTIIIPTYNEASNIETLISRIVATVPDVQVLVVDDSSPDGTGTIVEGIARNEPRVKLFSRKEKNGLGQAYIAGFKKMLGENKPGRIVMMDADFSHDPEYLPVMLEHAELFDVVIGSRYVAGGSTESWKLWRKMLSRGGNFYVRMITGLPVRDCTGGFNVINLDMLRRVPFDQMDSSGYAFIMELKFLLAQAGARFIEVPIVFRNRIGGESKLSSHIISEGILAPWKMRFKRKSVA